MRLNILAGELLIVIYNEIIVILDSITYISSPK